MESVCFTGACPDMTREELTEMAEEKFEVKSSVTKDLDILVCADPNAGSSKLEKAKKNGTLIISYEEFQEILDEDEYEGFYSIVQTRKILKYIREKYAMECVRIKPKKAESQLLMTASKFGGLPYWTAGEEFPKDKDGNMLTLLAQINFADVPHLPDYPEKGLLQIFILADLSAGRDMDDDGTTQNYWRVVWREDVDDSLALSADALHEMGVQSAEEIMQKEHERRDSQMKSGKKLTLEHDFPLEKEYALTFEKGISHPNQMLSEYNDMAMSAAKEFGYPVYEDPQGSFSEDLDMNDYFCEDSKDGTLHQIGGYPFFTQRDGRSEDEEEVLLLQIDSEYNTDINISFGDDGIANFFITPENLKKRDFSKVRYYSDCY